MINTFLYSLYGSVTSKNKKAPGIIAYRHQWLNALLGDQIEVVIALETLADAAWQGWLATPAGQNTTVTYAPVTHPTQPESSSKGDKEKSRAATKAMLKKWNDALTVLHPALSHPDTPRPLTLYGETWQPGDKGPIPDADFPPGLVLSHGFPAGADRAVFGSLQTHSPDAVRRSGASAPDPQPTPASAASRPSSETTRGREIAERLAGYGFGRSFFCAQQARLDECPF